MLWTRWIGPKPRKLEETQRVTLQSPLNPLFSEDTRKAVKPTNSKRDPNVNSLKHKRPRSHSPPLPFSENSANPEGRHPLDPIEAQLGWPATVDMSQLRQLARVRAETLTLRYGNWGDDVEAMPAKCAARLVVAWFSLSTSRRVTEVSMVLLPHGNLWTLGLEVPRLPRPPRIRHPTTEAGPIFDLAIRLANLGYAKDPPSQVGSGQHSFFSPIQTAGLSSATASNKRQRRVKLNVQRQINRCPGRCFLLIHVKSLGIFWRLFKCSRIEYLIRSPRFRSRFWIARETNKYQILEGTEKSRSAMATAAMATAAMATAANAAYLGAAYETLLSLELKGSCIYWHTFHFFIRFCWALGDVNCRFFIGFFYFFCFSVSDHTSVLPHRTKMQQATDTTRRLW